MSDNTPNNNPLRSEAAYGELFSPAEVYHENSKIFPTSTELFANIQAVNTTTKLRQMISRPFPGYTGYPTIPLPEIGNLSERSFEDILRGRRSIRKYTGEAITLEELGTILFAGGGIVSDYHDPDGSVWKLRTSPSGGGLYPVELYCMSFNVTGLDAGVYFFNPLQNHLERIQQCDLQNTLQDATRLVQEFGTASCCIALKCVMSRSNFKYGERAYRFVLLEAGHIAQNLLLGAQALGLGSLPIGGFVDDKINAIFKLDGCEEFIVYMVTIGRV